MGKVLKFRRRRHVRASAGKGRGTSAGHSPSGQLSENHLSAFSNLPTLISDPSTSAASFLPSLSARELTVDRGTSSIAAYARATVSSCSMADIIPISVNLPVLSTANLPDAQPVSSGHSTGMDLGIVLQNIDRLLETKGRNAHEVSRSAGVPDAIRNLRRAVKGEIKSTPTLRVIAALAEELGTSLNDLMQPRKKPEIQSAPGVRQAILEKIDWLDQQKQQALQELATLEDAEKPHKRKIR